MTMADGKTVLAQGQETLWDSDLPVMGGAIATQPSRSGLVLGVSGHSVQESVHMGDVNRRQYLLLSLLLLPLRIDNCHQQQSGCWLLVVWAPWAWVLTVATGT